MGKHNVEKPQVPASVLIKAVSNSSGYTQKEVKDILNVYYDTIFDFIVDNKEIHIPGIGRIWISDPKPHRYWDEKAGKIQHTITYPVLKFKPVQRFKDSLHGDVFRQMKEEYKAQIAALEAQETDKEFERVFNPPKRKVSKKKTSK
jgi:nucleoid DNA-binding protein